MKDLSPKQISLLDASIKWFEVAYRSYISDILINEFENEESFKGALDDIVSNFVQDSEKVSVVFSGKYLFKAKKFASKANKYFTLLSDSYASFNKKEPLDKKVPDTGDIIDLVFLFYNKCFHCGGDGPVKMFLRLEEFLHLSEEYHHIRNNASHLGSKKVSIDSCKSVMSFIDKLLQFIEGLNNNYFWFVSKNDIENKINELNKSLGGHLLPKINLSQNVFTKEEKKIIRNVLFYRLTIESSFFYLKRKIDDQIAASLELRNLWVSGPCGCGKSNSLLFYLIQNKINSCVSIDLSTCVGESVSEIFISIYEELCLKSNGNSLDLTGQSLRKIIKNIVNVLLCEYSEKDIVLFLDEIPIDNDSDMKIFVQKIGAIYTSYNSSDTGNSIKFILSSIKTPKKHLSISQEKVKEFFDFIELTFWSNQEIDDLQNIIYKYIDFNFSNEEKRIITKNVKGSPRVLKVFLDRYKSKVNELTFEDILSITVKDFIE